MIRPPVSIPDAATTMNGRSAWRIASTAQRIGELLARILERRVTRTKQRGRVLVVRLGMVR